MENVREIAEESLIWGWKGDSAGNDGRSEDVLRIDVDIAKCVGVRSERLLNARDREDAEVCAGLGMLQECAVSRRMVVKALEEG